MGTPVPADWPEIENDKVYMVTVDWYQDASGKTGCDQEYQGEHKCCEPGIGIFVFLAFELECKRGSELCTITGFSAQRLISVFGPYDNMGACLADL